MRRFSAKERKAAKVEIPQLMAQFNQSHPNLTLQQKFYVALSMFHDTYDEVASTSTSPATVDLSRNSLDTLCHDLYLEIAQYLEHDPIALYNFASITQHVWSVFSATNETMYSLWNRSLSSLYGPPADLIHLIPGANSRAKIGRVRRALLSPVVQIVIAMSQNFVVNRGVNYSDTQTLADLSRIMQSRGWTEKRLNSECQQTHILQALDLITPFMIAQVRLHNPADSFSFPSNRFRSDIPIANSPRYRNIELCGATTVPFQADFPTKVLAIYNSGILDSLHSAQYQIKAAHYFTRVCPYIIKRAHKLLFATRDATAAIPGLYPPAFTITHYILPHMNQIVEREGNFDFPLSNIPQSHNLAHMVNPIPVSGGDLFRLALDAGSVDPVLIFITHCAFDHLNGLLDWVPMLSKFGDNSSLGYGLRADDSVTYPWGNRQFHGRHHYDSIIQIGLGALRTFKLWAIAQNITELSSLSISDIQNSSLDLADSTTLFEIVRRTEKHRGMGGKFYQGNVGRIVGAAIPVEYGYDNY